MYIYIFFFFLFNIVVIDTLLNPNDGNLKID